MPEADHTIVFTLLYVCLGLMLVLLLGIYMVLSRLAHLERLLAGRTADSREVEVISERGPVIESRQGGQFDRFLEEDPARKLLSKKEQSTAFRKWRQEHGMNWSNS